MKRTSLSVAVSAVVCLGLLACNSSKQAPAGEAAATAALTPNANAVKVEFFVMSQCPYGVQVENGVKESLDTLGRDVDFHFDFIGTKGPNGELSSMHGPDEVTGDIVQLCAAKYAPAAVMNMITCQNKNSREVARNWESCATEAKIPLDPLKACLNGPEGKTLLTESFTRAEARGARGSPTMFVNGKPYNGRRGPKDFLRGICAEFTGTKPVACTTIPESPKVNVTVISDKRCAECNTAQLVSMLQSQVANPNINALDYSDAAGRKLVDDLGATTLPLVLFDDTLKADTEASQGLGRYLKPLGTMQTLNVGASFMPACANEGGCALDQCKSTLACRPEQPNKLELFVMSQCPYGVQALNSMQEVLANFKGNVDFKVNYIANGSAQAGFQSLHGQAEVDEDIRELCVIKNYSKNAKYMDYVLCRNKDIRSGEWEKCATNGIDAKVVKTCSTSDEGKKLLEESLKVSNALAIGASPTWIANGKYKFSGIDAQSIKSNLCSHNPKLAGCDATLSTNTNGTPQGGCAQ